MKLLLVVQWYYPIGGIESFVWRLIQQLDPDISIILAVEFSGQKTDLVSPASNITIVDVSKGIFTAIQHLIESEEPDVIHANHISLIGLSALLAARKKHIPLVVTNHQVPEYRAFWWQKYTNPIIWLYLKAFDRLAQTVIAPSPTVNKLLNQHGINKNIQTISCGVNTELFKPRDKLIVRHTLAITNKLTILFVGRIAKDKNIEVLLQAIAKLRMTYEFQLFIIGPKTVKGNVSKEIEDLIIDLKIQNIVTILGYIAADSELLAYYYSASDVLIIPSLFETQSIVTLEAMASGLAIVASNSGALPDLVERGTNGFLFDPLSSEDLAAKLSLLFENPHTIDKMGKRSKQMVQIHDIAHTTRQYEAAYGWRKS